MTELWIAGGLLVAVVLGVAGWRMRYPYKAQKRLFTNAEWRFYQHLERAIGGSHLVMAKVRIADVLTVHGRRSQTRGWWRAFTRISSKHIDFIICDRDNGTILCGIELDDRSHFRGDRRRRDRFVNGAFEKAGLPLLRYPVQRRGYDIHGLRRSVLQAIAAARPQGGIA
ncbi:DUF2726 domain-containing protein [Halomonas sp. C05BenzN]|uniref:DUF2726 domain-containing protein n=1 Tax=Halomonas sp. C05BenzN TaxID=3411041 RepID=UPI003B95BB1C